MISNSQLINIDLVTPNMGQIPNLPKNPRIIKDHKYKKLKQNIIDYPEMLSYRELIVIPDGKFYVVIAGNMRLKACQELKYKEIPCKVLDHDTDVEKLKAYTILDNSPFGENDWDSLANEWDQDCLSKWGLDVPADIDLSNIKSNENRESLNKTKMVVCPECGHEFGV